MTHVQRKTSTHPQRQWFAADMTIIPSGDFMMGTLGYAEQLTQVEFDPDAWSWIKGATRSDDTGSEQTVVPFAIDLRESERWVAFAPTGRMQPRQFVSGFQRVLNEAVVEAGLLPVDWEVDLVTSEGRIEAWLHDHPRVFWMRRTIKFSNPGKDLSDDEAEMRALAANRKTEEFAAPRGQTLNTEVDDFREKIEGTGRGNLDIILKARSLRGQSKQVFNSRNSADYTYVDDFGTNLEQGIETVLRALREYVDKVRGLGQSRLSAADDEGPDH
ncbi:hypothetical protein N798_00270 [Knoellia flava TL1]|uniref:Uncharacterized protein n=2 Tax=Knoellia flava TaxID=913969 RepID=A0A8H9KQV9_9MICO|nr:hypothetical protein [Knoellia flava]KGN36018.1 hypothetical protein N798_00270 [Knoellia flava TL1]GGB81345.1 hypothetical protein GCM10011314_21190 [Knoellia flava]